MGNTMQTKRPTPRPPATWFCLSTAHLLSLVILLISWYGFTTTAQADCVLNSPPYPITGIWQGTKSGDAATGNGSTAAPDNWAGRTLVCTAPDQSGDVTITQLGLNSGDNAYFYLPVPDYEPNSISLDGPNFGRVDFGMEGDADFSGSLNASGLVNTLGYGLMHFNGVTITANSFNSTSSNLENLEMTFTGGGLNITNDINLYGQADSTNTLTVTGGTFNAGTLLADSPEIDLVLNGGTSGTVKNGVTINPNAVDETNITVSGEGTDLDWAKDSGLSVLGQDGKVTLTVSDKGKLNTHSTFVAVNSTADVSVTVDGGTWQTDTLALGGSGKVMVDIKGGQMSTGDTNMALFDNTAAGNAADVLMENDAKWDVNGYLTVGAAGDATLSMYGASQLTVNGAMTLSVAATANGYVSLDDTARLVVNGELDVGAIGEGGLDILGRSTVDVNGQMVIADAENSHGEVLALSGDTLQVTQSLEVGRNGTGELIVSDGGHVVTEGSAFLGTYEHGNGTVTIDDIGLWHIDGDLNIGNSGKGTLTVSDGGHVEMAGDGELRIGRHEGSTGSLTVTGTDSTIELSGTDTPLVIGQDGTGTFSLEEGAVLDAGGQEVDVGEGGTGDGTLHVTGSGSSLTVGSLTVGVEGTGHATVAEGAELNADELVIGKEESGKGDLTVTGADVSAGDVTVGESGTGSLGLEEGGRLDQSDGHSFILGEEDTGSGALTISGDGSRLTGDTLVVGDKGTGTVTLDEKAAVDVNSMTIGAEEDSNGSVAVVGESTLTVAGGLVVGEGSKDAEMHIADHSVVNSGGGNTTASILGDNEDSKGTVTLADTQSKWNVFSDLLVGNRGDGSLEVADGAELDVYGHLDLGGTPTGTGEISIKGADTGGVVSYSTLEVGTGGRGDITVEEHGLLTGGGAGTQAVVGGAFDNGDGTFSPGQGRVTVKGADAFWQSHDQNGVAVGARGEGTLDVEEGATVQIDGALTLGTLSEDASGTVMVNGPGSRLLTGAFNIGGEGSGSLIVQDKGEVESTDAAVSGTAAHPGQAALDDATWNTDTLTVQDHSSVTLTGDARVNVAQHLNVRDQGVLHTEEGAVTVGDQSNPAAFGSVYVNSGGLLSGDGTIFGDVFADGGVIAPGNSPGILTINGDFTLDVGSILQIQIAGAAPGLFDQLLVSGSVDFVPGSHIEFTFLDGYLPQMDDIFSFITADKGITGLTSDLFLFPTLQPDFQYDILLDNGTFRLRALNDATAATPEPNSEYLFGMGILMLAGIVKKGKWCRKS